MSAGSDDAAERARRRAELFGEVLPLSTADDRDPAEERAERESASEEWLRRNVPPHHG